MEIPEMKAITRSSLRIHLIRHGETEWSLSGRHTGTTDIGLTEHGVECARSLATRLQGIRFTHILVSPRSRALLTCHLAGFSETAIYQELVEWDYGDYEGRTAAHILSTRPDWLIFRDGCPGGESTADVSHRADQVITRLQTMQGNVAIFTHGHFGRVLAARWLGLSIVQARHFLLSTASISILCCEHERTDRPAIDLWNSTDGGPIALPSPDPAALKQRALDRWENEGDEIPS
jgi:probable phosphoglycerate mutase